MPKISALPSATEVNDPDQFVLLQGDETKRVTKSVLSTSLFEESGGEDPVPAVQRWTTLAASTYNTVIPAEVRLSDGTIKTDIADWASGETVYAEDDFCKPTTGNESGFVYRCMAAGTADASTEPDWLDLGDGRDGAPVLGEIVPELSGSVRWRAGGINTIVTTTDLTSVIWAGMPIRITLTGGSSATLYCVAVEVTATRIYLSGELPTLGVYADETYSANAYTKIEYGRPEMVVVERFVLGDPNTWWRVEGTTGLVSDLHATVEGGYCSGDKGITQPLVRPYWNRPPAHLVNVWSEVNAIYVHGGGSATLVPIFNVTFGTSSDPVIAAVGTAVALQSSIFGLVPSTSRNQLGSRSVHPDRGRIILGDRIKFTKAGSSNAQSSIWDVRPLIMDLVFVLE